MKSNENIRRNVYWYLASFVYCILIAELYEIKIYTP